ncbi:glutamate--tRNA ligase [Candidatus Woesebacteria bacterium]|nr:glutamate--tRNA ligase [Candidatus Woesebacteria bacterium]
MPNIRTRIAPSPTGFAHVGTAYTALFNYAFARRNRGKFILRLEDTDIKRNVKGAEESIYDGLSWLGISWDEGPFRQSERLEIYKKKAKELLDKKIAYEDEGAIRFKNPGEDVSWGDLIHGKINFPGGQITDFVIMKSDGYPTYNFAAVVDDILMTITHVIRGEEHISNTPRQLAIYKAFEANPPFFAHHPTLRNENRKKLSKRRDPVDLRIYQKEGYLPQALVNFLCLLGWSHPDEKEIFNLDEFVSLFDLKRVRKAGPIFDTKKLDWINGEYIRQLPVDQLNSKFEIRARSGLLNSKFKALDQNKKLAITGLVRERIKKLSDFDKLAGFFFEKPQVDEKLFGKNYKVHLEKALYAISAGEDLLEVVKENKFKTGDFFMDLRIAITGSHFTPPVNESIEILGKEEVIERIKAVL